jgi:hypothetical protein
LPRSNIQVLTIRREREREKGRGREGERERETGESVCGMETQADLQRRRD